MEFRLGELFCGPGGIGYAAMTAQSGDPSYKISHAWANDYDTCQTYIKYVRTAKDALLKIRQYRRTLSIMNLWQGKRSSRYPLHRVGKLHRIR
jgi:hypothetical protein